MESNISITRAARNLSDFINRVRYRGEEFVIERGGRPVCRLVPVRNRARFTGADLKKLLASVPKPDPGYWDTLEEILRNHPELPEAPWRS
jgi:prevent-host-death family protein